MRIPAKITSSCIWVVIPVDWVILHWFRLWCGRTVSRAGGRCTVTWLPHFLGWVEYFIFLPIVLRWRASRARAALQITKIVRSRSDWPRDVFAWEYVNTCGVKMFCSSRANHTSTNFKMFLSWKLDKFTFFTHSLVGWNLKNFSKHAVPIFLRLSCNFKREKPFFGKRLYCKVITDYTYIKLRVQDFATGENFSFNQ